MIGSGDSGPTIPSSGPPIFDVAVSDLAQGLTLSLVGRTLEMLVGRPQLVM